MNRSTTRDSGSQHRWGERSPESPGGSSDPRPSARSRAGRFAIALIGAVALLLGSAVAFGQWGDVDGAVPTLPDASEAPAALVNGVPAEVAAARELSLAQMDRRYGVRVDMVGVSAAGGLLDLRLTITDPERAAALFGVHYETSTGDTHGSGAMPRLFQDDAPYLIEPAGAMAHHVRLGEDAHFFMLYPNPGGFIQGGSDVSVLLGGKLVSGIVARA